ncbi:hypothetical protein [Nocardia sp. NPDC019395]|uniref:hypothetical protein n=1 Tax=Nocardia sp. NPDC019395 TaxID=3154686 RepID=UPI0033D451B5
MYRTVHIDGHRYQVIGRIRLSAVSRACYGKYRFTLRRTTDGTLWTAYDHRVTGASELLRNSG